MKNRRLGLIIIILLAVSLTASLQLVKANYLPPPSIEVSSPLSVPKVYSNSSVPLQVTVNIETDKPPITSIIYNIDATANVTLADLTRIDNRWYWTSPDSTLIQGTAFMADVSLDNLAEGTHRLTVCSHAADGEEMTLSVTFTVDYDYVSPQNTYSWLPTLQPPANTDDNMLENSMFILLIAGFIAAPVVYFARKRKPPKSQVFI